MWTATWVDSLNKSKPPFRGSVTRGRAESTKKMNDQDGTWTRDLWWDLSENQRPTTGLLGQLYNILRNLIYILIEFVRQKRRSISTRHFGTLKTTMTELFFSISCRHWPRPQRTCDIYLWERLCESFFVPFTCSSLRWYAILLSIEKRHDKISKRTWTQSSASHKSRNGWVCDYPFSFPSRMLHGGTWALDQMANSIFRKLATTYQWVHILRVGENSRFSLMTLMQPWS